MYPTETDHIDQCLPIDSGRHSLRRSAISWAVYEGGYDSYVALVMVAVFMPYFSNYIIGDPVRGQATVAQYGEYAGWIVMILGPIAGATVDEFGPRKPWLLAAAAIMVPLMCLLWWVRPTGPSLSIPQVVAVATAVSVLLSTTFVIHNSMMLRAAGPSESHKASGLALALGNFIPIVIMVLDLWAFALPGKVVSPFLPSAPLFGISGKSHAEARIVGPICGILLATSIIPLLAFSRDYPRSGYSLSHSFSRGVRSLLSLLSNLRGNSNAALFLFARMFYVDAMTAGMLFAGVYASGVMGWDPATMLIFGIILGLSGGVGGLAAAVLDSLLGPKRSVQIELGTSILATIMLLGVKPATIFYIVSPPGGFPDLWHLPVFKNAPQLLFLLFSVVSSIASTANFASSRTLLTRLTPPERAGAFFGLYGLSSTATAWLGATLVSLGTTLFHSQQAGLSAIILLLAGGLVGVSFVRVNV